MEEMIYFFQRFTVFLSAPFLELINISITAGWIVIAAVLIRFLFKKAPKRFSCLLWGIVGLRLIFPFSIESVFSLIPSTETINPDAVYSDSFELNSGFHALDSTVNELYDNADLSASSEVEIAGILATVWLIGAAAMLIYAFVSRVKLGLRLRTATKKEGNIYQSENVQSPFVLGAFRPKIYLPYRTDAADVPLIIAHERAHIKRLDHIIKPIGFMMLSVHWFNPLLWLAYILLCRDIESACDEKVIRELGEDCRRSYSTALLNSSISRRSIVACPLAFGEVGVKERIKGVMNYKKPALWVIIAAVTVCIIAAVCFLTNPKEETKPDNTPIISSELDQLISTNVINQNQGKYLSGTVSCEAHEVLATQTATRDDMEIITVYIVSMYQEYSVENGKLTEKGGCITPLALSFLVEEDISTGEDCYALTEYWEPGMGTEYAKDLEAKFPEGVDYDTQVYVNELDKRCIQQAMDYFGLSETDTTEELTDNFTTNAVNAKEDYDLTVKKSRSSGVTWLTNDDYYRKHGHHAYLYCLDEAYVTIDGKDIYIGDALNSGKLTAEILTKKAEKDVKAGTAKSDMLKDGGTVIYRYDDYTVIVRNALTENANTRNTDLIIGYADMSVSDYSACVKFIEETSGESTTADSELNGVTAPVSYNDGPAFDAVIIENYGGTLLVETLTDSSGISKGTKVSVGLSTVLSYLPNIDPELLEKGDKIRVIYDDTNIMETYPLQVKAWAVYAYIDD